MGDSVWPSIITVRTVSISKRPKDQREIPQSRCIFRIKYGNMEYI